MECLENAVGGDEIDSLDPRLKEVVEHLRIATGGRFGVTRERSVIPDDSELRTDRRREAGVELRESVRGLRSRFAEVKLTEGFRAGERVLRYEGR